MKELLRSSMMKLPEGFGLVKHLPQPPTAAQPHLPSCSPNHTPQDKKEQDKLKDTHMVVVFPAPLCPSREVIFPS